MEDLHAPLKAILVLSDGTVYQGLAVGKKGTVTGEICFDTGMTGYQEMYSDPSSGGQIVVSTFSHIGNYGVKEEENESDGAKIAGLICRNFSEHYSRKQGDGSLQSYLEEDGVVGITNVDTRALVRKIRSSKALRAVISSEETDPTVLKKRLKDSAAETPETQSGQAYTAGDESAEHRVAILDFGVLKSFITDLTEKGCFVKVFGAEASLEEILAWKPDGIVLSGGAGDPNDYSDGVALAEKLIRQDVPVLGVGLGHQLLALATGVPVERMPHGHRGKNHPVLNKVTGLGDITLQNHGFGINKSAFEGHENLELTHLNLNDESVEGFRFKEKRITSVQFYPQQSEATEGNRNILNEFLSDIKKYKQVKV